MLYPRTVFSRLPLRQAHAQPGNYAPIEQILFDSLYQETRRLSDSVTKTPNAHTGAPGNPDAQFKYLLSVREYLRYAAGALTANASDSDNKDHHIIRGRTHDVLSTLASILRDHSGAPSGFYIATSAKYRRFVHDIVNTLNHSHLIFVPIFPEKLVDWVKRSSNAVSKPVRARSEDSESIGNYGVNVYSSEDTLESLASLEKALRTLEDFCVAWKRLGM